MNKNNYSEFYENGFQIFDNFLSKKEISYFKLKLNEIYNLQQNEFGFKNLLSINEENMVRAPFLYDESFIKLFSNQDVLKIVYDILGEHCILSLQNSIIISPNQKHHQSFYHRDIIHQDFVSSKPLGINLYFCLNEYSEQNGGTCFIPKSHKYETFPKNNYEEIYPVVREGSIILFDSMIYHKAGSNKSNEFRYGINNMFTLPFIKQQINFPHALKGKYSDQFPINKLLGYNSREFYDVVDFRNHRLKRVLK
jgi:ectoine hydroxylase-related dioxygenase (phytanoyl-CoA dioxygenase family)